MKVVCKGPSGYVFLSVVPTDISEICHHNVQNDCKLPEDTSPFWKPEK